MRRNKCRVYPRVFILIAGAAVSRQKLYLLRGRLRAIGHRAEHHILALPFITIDRAL